MINSESLQAVQSSTLAGYTEHFGKPLYESYCFAQIPQTVYHLLTGDGNPGLPISTLGDLPQRYDKVILLFVDAFGWRFFEQYCAAYPFLQRFADQGVVSKLTTQFPSTTSAHTTTIHTGLPVGQSGVFEWFYFEPTLDQIIAPLLFSFAGDHGRETLRSVNADPRKLFPTTTLYQRLNAQGVRSHVFMHRDYATSPFSSAVQDGAHITGFRTIPEALSCLSDAVTAEKGPAYFYLYLDTIDTLLHLYGPGARPVDAEVDMVMTMIDRLLVQALAGKVGKTLLLVTADHGQIEVSPDTTVYLNRLTPSIEPFVCVNGQGKLLIPAGSPRDMFLYIQPEKRDEAIALLRRQLEGRAAVFGIEELIAQGCFGTAEPSPTFLGRVGNVVILPYAHETVWWYEKGKYEMRFRGSHGGLARQEMETVLLALPL